ncbi:hypothetical protein I4F81_006385 [Pyropia yezoensis]|uniref:Uncharacterized protein n=1 Tax=Pyropia yezoensis TaxID=2788 RepID=A0ACC3C1K2_PYRYE|nr:hypothetical protein I4F81_006385 [Neopyropia yezoensis]
MGRRSASGRHSRSSAQGAQAASTRKWGLSAEKEALLQAWLPQLRSGEMAVVHAANNLGCSQGLVARAKNGTRGVLSRGRPPVLTTEEEMAIEKQILYWHARGAPLLEVDVCASVQQYINHDVEASRSAAARAVFKDGRPGRQWMRGFLKRHPKIGKATSRSMDAVRAAATNPENLARMMALLKLVREEKKVSAANVFNADECGIKAKDLLGSRKKRRLVASGSSGARVVVPNVSQGADFLTLLPVIAADGSQLPPTFIVKGTPGNPKRRRRIGQGDGAWEFLNELAPPDAPFLYRTPAGMDGDTWTEWCVFIAERVFSKLLPDEAKILIIDGCRAHIGYEALAALARVNVEVFILAANTTHATQQLDVTLFQPLKYEVREELARETTETDIVNNKQATLGIFDLVKRVSRAYEKTFTSSLIRVAFKETGVEPWDPSKLEKHTAMSDSSKRTRKRKHTLARLTTRMAPTVAKQRHSLQWERGTLRTTQAVFLDEDNRKWLAKQQAEREAAEKKKQDGKRQRAHATANRKEEAVKKAAERQQRLLLAQEKKAAGAAALEVRRAAAEAKRAATRAAKEAKQKATDERRQTARPAGRGQGLSGRAAAARTAASIAATAAATHPVARPASAAASAAGAQT